MLQSALLKFTHGYINGQWCAADSGLSMPVINPATGESLSMVPVRGRGETTRAVEAAVGTSDGHRLVLQRAFAALVADRAVDRMVDQQRLFHLGAALLALVAIRDEHRAVFCGRLAGRHDLRDHRDLWVYPFPQWC